MKRFTHVVLLLVLVSLCALPEARAEARAAARGTGAAAPVSLADTVEAAFAYSPALKSGQAGREAAAADVDRARAGYLPTIGVWAGTGLVQNADATTRLYREDTKTQRMIQGSAMLTQPLYSGGATTARVTGSRAALDAADNQLMDTASALAFEAVSAHADLLRRAKLVLLAENNVKEHEGILRTVKQRFSQGVATSGEVTQIESRLARARATLLSQRAGLDAARAAYLRVTGQPAPANLLAVDNPGTQFPDLERAESQSLLTNPRLRMGRANIDVARSEREVVKGRFLPSLNAQAGYSDRFQSARSAGNGHGFEVSLNAQWELYSGGADTASLTRAAAGIRRAEQELRRYEDQLMQDVASTLARTEAAVQQTREYGAAMDFARKTRQSFYSQFQAGQRSLLDVLDAEAEFFNSASEQEVSRVDGILGYYRLLALAGILLEELRLDAEPLKTVAAPSRPFQAE